MNVKKKRALWGDTIVTTTFQCTKRTVPIFFYLAKLFSRLLYVVASNQQDFHHEPFKYQYATLVVIPLNHIQEIRSKENNFHEQPCPRSSPGLIVTSSSPVQVSDSSHAKILLFTFIVTSLLRPHQ